MPNVHRQKGFDTLVGRAGDGRGARAAEARPSSITFRAPGRPATGTRSSGDFAPGATSHQGLRRPPKSAVDFVTRFNAQLGLARRDLDDKVDHMASDPGRFMTAMPALFFADVKGPWAVDAQLRATAAPQSLLVGDCHLGNLTTHPGPAGKTVWGWGDCDKSGVGRLDWDLDRLAAHIVISARASNKHFSGAAQAELVAALSQGYCLTLREFVATGLRPAGALTANELPPVLRDFVKAHRSQSQDDFIKNLAPHGEFPRSQQPSKAQRKEMVAALDAWATRLPADAPVRRPLKVLSLGVNRSVGGSNSGLDKYLVLVAPALDSDPPVALKFKEILPSAVSVGTGDLSQANAAQTMANTATLEGYRNPLAGYASVAGRSCTVEPMTANQAIVDPQGLGKSDFLALATSAGVALARSHLQSPSLDAAWLKTWLGEATTDAQATARLQQFATGYADQVEADTRELKKAD